MELLANIVDIIKTKELQVSLVKVKAHADDQWNNKVDLLAKKGLTLNRVIEPTEIRSQTFSFKLLWNNIKVEANPRSFIKLLQQLEIGAKWCSSKAILKIKEKDSANIFE